MINRIGSIPSINKISTHLIVICVIALTEEIQVNVRISVKYNKVSGSGNMTPSVACTGQSQN